MPRKRGRWLAGVDFVHFGLESLFFDLRKLRVCMNGVILSILNEKERGIIMQIVSVAVLN